jgi:hypothetical protein
LSWRLVVREEAGALLEQVEVLLSDRWRCRRSFKTLKTGVETKERTRELGHQVGEIFTTVSLRGRIGLAHWGGRVLGGFDPNRGRSLEGMSGRSFHFWSSDWGLGANVFRFPVWSSVPIVRIFSSGKAGRLHLYRWWRGPSGGSHPSLSSR